MTTHIVTKNGQRGLVTEPTGVLSSSRCVRQEPKKKCIGDDALVPLGGERAAGAQVDPQVVFEAIFRGVARQQQDDASLGNAIGKMIARVHVVCSLHL